MVRDEALRLAREIAWDHRTVRAYCRAQNVPASTVASRAYRAGVNLGAAVRAYRVRWTGDYALKRGVTLSRAAVDTGWSSYQSFYRALRSVRAWPEWELTA